MAMQAQVGGTVSSFDPYAYTSDNVFSGTRTMTGQKAADQQDSVRAARARIADAETQR